jgi:futalosine hydrolase
MTEDLGLPPVLVLAAVETEMEPFRRRLESLASVCVPRLILTGAGKTAAAIHATRALGSAPCALAVQIGVAGALPGSMLEPGDVVLATSEFLADEGVEAPTGWLDLLTLGLPSAVAGGRVVHNEVPVSIPARTTLSAIEASAAGRYAVRAGRLATVSTGSGTDSAAARIASRSSALAETMEGAAAALAALHHGIPFYEVRGISNRAGARDRGSWVIETAADHAAETAALLVRLELSRG